MAALRMPRRAYRLACPNFGADEIKALRSMFSLLQHHLKQPWEIVQDDEADLLIVNLDSGPPGSLPPEVPVIGCALKPRQHPSGTLHRPLRAGELLALLTEQAAQVPVPAEAAPMAAEGLAERRFRLLGWPAGFEQWPAGWHRVLAATSREARSPADIAARTGVPEAEVGRCLDRLERDGLVDVVVFHPRPDAQAPAPRPGRWSGLAARVGLLLGFQR